MCIYTLKCPKKFFRGVLQESTNKIEASSVQDSAKTRLRHVMLLTCRIQCLFPFGPTCIHVKWLFAENTNKIYHRPNICY